MSRLLAVLTLFALAALTVFYYAALDTYHSLSPQGCRMSWMWPSYVLQSKFDRTWTPLAQRYSLWLYREGNLENNQLLNGAPVLFIPGNAGSSHQVRSIASSAAHQYYAAPYQVSPEFSNGRYTGLDFYAVEYNEDLSAFHGSTIDTQVAYASRAVEYILSLYPPGTSITVMGHSMGGIIATALLPNPNISAIITMSTPHTLPPVRFDRRIDHMYAENHRRLASDPTPVLSLCGGATDLMIPSESCILSPAILNFSPSVYRRTVFTTALEGCWTGVGHLAMVWCHQVRWRVARAALEIAASKTLKDREASLDKWLRDGHAHGPLTLTADGLPPDDDTVFAVSPQENLLVRDPVGTASYLVPVPAAAEGQNMATFVLYASQGAIPPISPHKPFPFRTSVRICENWGTAEASCLPVTPKTHKLIPNPIRNSAFPVPDEGVDESEGVALLEVDVVTGEDRHLVVTVENGDRRGWLFGGFSQKESVVVNTNLAKLLVSRISVQIPDGIRSQTELPSLPANSLLVYQVKAIISPGSACDSSSTFLPLLTHDSHASETHYYPLDPSFRRPILLHSHAAAPYVASDHPFGHNLTIHSSGECQIDRIELTVNWWATVGRWGTRYGPAAVCWAIGIMAILTFDVWLMVEGGAPIPDVKTSLDLFARKRLPWLTMSSFFVSLVPFRVGIWLGNGGVSSFAPLSVLLLPISFGMVCIMWWFLTVLLWPLGRFVKLFGRRREDTTLRRPTTALVSMAVIFLLIFVLVPWQVAYLGCWLIHLYTCAAILAELSVVPSAPPRSSTEAVPLVRMSSTESEDQFVNQHTPSEEAKPASPVYLSLPQQANGHLHVLLFMTWLLPLVAPVLAVWVRTLATAGVTTPFDGDHNFMYVAPFLVLVEVLGGGTTGAGVKAFFGGRGRERVSPRWGMVALALVAFFVGPRTTYMVFEMASVALGWAVLRRIGPMYWGGGI